jgi:hypothetical protein
MAKSAGLAETAGLGASHVVATQFRPYRRVLFMIEQLFV